MIVGAVLLVLSGGTLALVYGLSSRYNGKAGYEDILGEGGVKNQNPQANGPFNFLILGSDSREKTDTQTPDEDGTNSDTIMLVHIAEGLHSAFLVSIPRDSWVDIPAAGSWKGGKDKINAAFRYGGAALTAKTVFGLTKIPLDGAVIINFAGIEKMVNAVGGVKVCPAWDVPNHFTDFPQYNAGWKTGRCYEMQGEEAMVFVRQRYDVPGGDFGRVRDQQLVIKALADKATSSGVLLNPAKLDSLLVTVAESLTLDKSMNLRDLAFQFKGISSDHLTFATAPVNGTQKINDQSTVQLNFDKCAELFKAVQDDKTDQWLAAHPQPKVPDYGAT